MQTVGEFVEVLETGWHTNAFTTTITDRFDFGERITHEVRQLLVILGSALVGDVIHLCLCAIDDVVDIALALIAHLHDARTGFNEPAEDCAFVHDLRVVTRVCCRWHTLHKCVEIRRTTNACGFTFALEFRTHRQRINGFTATVEIEDHTEDRCV